MTTLSQTHTVTRSKASHYLLVPKNCDPLIHYSLIFLSFYGLLMIASASMGLASNKPIWYLVFIVIKQIIFLTGGFFAMLFIIRKFRFKFLHSWVFTVTWLALGAALVLCIIFPATNGAKAWLRFPVSSFDISIQPSEFVKIIVPMVVAAYCGDVKKQFKNDWDMFHVPFFIVVGYLGIVIGIQSDFGSAMVIGFIALFCVLVPKNRYLTKLQIFLWFSVLFIFAFVLFLLSDVGQNLVVHIPFLKEYQVNRFLSSINPFIDQFNTGYQLVNGLVSFASGGWTGLGFGNSVRKYTNFPAANTDFILAIVVEELGMIGFGLIFIPYLIIVIQLFKYAIRMKSEKGRIILVGTAMYLIIHSLFNVGGVTGMIPLTGVPLLMISSGGSSTMAFMMAIGVAQAVIAQYNRGEIA